MSIERVKVTISPCRQGTYNLVAKDDVSIKKKKNSMMYGKNKCCRIPEEGEVIFFFFFFLTLKHSQRRLTLTCTLEHDSDIDNTRRGNMVGAEGQGTGSGRCT